MAFHSFTENSKSNYLGIIVGVALGGVLFGIVVCAAAFFLIIQRLKKSQDMYGFIFLTLKKKENGSVDKIP